MITVLLRFLWRLVAAVSVLLGFIGVVIPGMPTTVFMLIAVWAGGKGWPQLSEWILQHPRFGPPIANWQQFRVIPRSVKWLAGGSMMLSWLIMELSPMDATVKCIVSITMLSVLLWLLTRREVHR